MNWEVEERDGRRWVKLVKVRDAIQVTSNQLRPDRVGDGCYQWPEGSCCKIGERWYVDEALANIIERNSHTCRRVSGRSKAWQGAQLHPNFARDCCEEWLNYSQDPSEPANEQPELPNLCDTEQVRATSYIPLWELAEELGAGQGDVQKWMQDYKPYIHWSVDFGPEIMQVAANQIREDFKRDAEASKPEPSDQPDFLITVGLDTAKAEDGVAKLCECASEKQCQVNHRPHPREMLERSMYHLMGKLLNGASIGDKCDLAHAMAKLSAESREWQDRI